MNTEHTAAGTGHAQHDDGDGHDHGSETVDTRRLVGALILAVAAEAVGYFAPDAMVWRGVGLAVAALAIGLAGFDVR